MRTSRLLLLIPITLLIGGCSNVGLKANCTDTFGTYRQGCEIVYERGDYYVISGGNTTYYTGEYMVQAEGSSHGVMLTKYKDSYQITGGDNIAFRNECIISYPRDKRYKSMIKQREAQFGK